MNAVEPDQAKIESVHVKGFRSLADFKVDDLPNPTVMIGPNGAGKSNVFCFLEMVGRAIRHHSAHAELRWTHTNPPVVTGHYPSINS